MRDAKATLGQLHVTGFWNETWLTRLRQHLKGQVHAWLWQSKSVACFGQKDPDTVFRQNSNETLQPVQELVSISALIRLDCCHKSVSVQVLLATKQGSQLHTGQIFNVVSDVQ